MRGGIATTNTFIRLPVGVMDGNFSVNHHQSRHYSKLSHEEVSIQQGNHDGNKDNSHSSQQQNQTEAQNERKQRFYGHWTLSIFLISAFLVYYDYSIAQFLSQSHSMTPNIHPGDELHVSALNMRINFWMYAMVLKARAKVYEYLLGGESSGTPLDNIRLVFHGGPIFAYYEPTPQRRLVVRRIKEALYLPNTNEMLFWMEADNHDQDANHNIASGQGSPTLDSSNYGYIPYTHMYGELRLILPANYGGDWMGFLTHTLPWNPLNLFRTRVVANEPLRIESAAALLPESQPIELVETEKKILRRLIPW
eukprot:CAMPEP_0117438210 /NCGR_PEP_ID=MMETSP0759-20121206/1935_1 /TAXON_ID=63605 /ORGANISM="Percolomonas cosmopolitus, Strain WS" /LENGTH=307 /DNA_ID=CAMNT_0005229893 /DNA_START=152 /DNA_END=1075 /DNA_ORIENTATION=+